MRHYIGQTRNNINVYVELIGSEAGKQIAHHPQLLTFAKEMVPRITIKSNDVCIEHDMERSIGYSFIVPTTDQSSVFYGRITKEELYTRFVRNVKPSTTTYLTIEIAKDSATDYTITNIWAGRLRPARPGTESDTAESKEYWESHAVVYSEQHLQMQTVTKVCPY